MKKIISASFLAAFALTMLLPVTRQVNAASVNHSVLRQGGNPLPGAVAAATTRAGIPCQEVVAAATIKAAILCRGAVAAVHWILPEFGPEFPMPGHITAGVRGEYTPRDIIWPFGPNS